MHDELLLNKSSDKENSPAVVSARKFGQRRRERSIAFAVALVELALVNRTSRPPSASVEKIMPSKKKKAGAKKEAADEVINATPKPSPALDRMRQARAAAEAEASPPAISPEVPAASSPPVRNVDMAMRGVGCSLWFSGSGHYFIMMSSRH